MTCPFLQCGRCSLAEQHATRELAIQLECRPDDATCAACLKSGTPNEKRPSIPCIGLVTRQLSAAHLSAWRPYVAWLRKGQVRPQPQPARPQRASTKRKREAQTEKPRRSRRKWPRNVCIYKGDAVDSFACGCAGGGSRAIYSCAVAGKCCDFAEHVERGVEHLRKRFPDDKAERRFKACQGCPDYLPLVTLSLEPAN